MPRKIKDLTGQRFGRLTVVSRAENSASGKPMWNCVCDCGAQKVVAGSALSNGTKSCGCYRREWAAKKAYKHGDAHNRLYSVWNMMKQRCNDPNNAYYKCYGGRGIKVCAEWGSDFATFRDWALANGYDETAATHKCTIDRIDNYGDYCPENCRWTDAKAQARNTRNNRIIEYCGTVKPLSAWAEEMGIQEGTIQYRIKNGWSVEDALTTKPKKWRKNNG